MSAPEPPPGATADEGTSEEPQGRLTTALRRPGRRQLVVGLLLGILGFAAAAQVVSRSEADTYRGARTDELVSVLAGQTAARQRADAEIERLERDRDELLTSNDARATAVRRTREEVARLGVLAGTVPAVGPGVRVTVQDPEGAIGINQLLNAVQELRDSGAEVIEVDDRIRLVASSWFDDSALGIVVDGQQVSPPYVIEAIGEPGTLAGGLDFTGGFVDDVESRGGTVEVLQLGEVRIDSTVE